MTLEQLLDLTEPYTAVACFIAVLAMFRNKISRSTRWRSPCHIIAAIGFTAFGVWIVACGLRSSISPWYMIGHFLMGSLVILVLYLIRDHWYRDRMPST